MHLKLLLLFFFFIHFSGLNAQLVEKNEIKNLLEKGINNYKQGNLDLAESQLSNVLKSAVYFGDEPSSLRASTNLGNVYADKGNNSSALLYYQKALRIALRISDVKHVAHINKNIGALFVSMKRFDESLLYYFKAEKQAVQLKDELLIADCNNNIGIVYEQQGLYSKAIERYNNALKWYLKNNEISGVGMIYSNLAIVFKLNKKYDEALVYYKKSVVISDQMNDQWAKAATLNNIGNLYGEIGQYDLALNFCEQSLAISKSIKAPEISVMAYESMANAAAVHSDFKEAFRFQKLYDEAKSKFDNIENNRALSELNIRFNTERKEQENQLLQSENKLKSIQIEKANKQRNYWITVSIISILALLLISKLVQINRQSKQRIEQQKLINKTAFDTEQSERTRIARDLHDSVGQKLAVVKMQLSMTDNDQISAASALLDQAIHDVRSASHNLMPIELSNGLISAVEEMAENINFSIDTTQILLDISPEVQIARFNEQTELYVYRAIQEISTNALKYAEAESIQIQMEIHGSALKITIHDDGKGFNTNEIEPGLGLKNIKTRIAQLNGSFQLDSENLKGTRFQFSIPV